MRLRLQEIHPSIVHFPVTLIPTAIVADAIGRATDSRSLMEVGRLLMPVAAASAAIAGAAGLLAQGAVRAEGRARDQLATHRNLNAGLMVLTAILAGVRARRARPGPGYLLAGFGGLAALSYSAYLGGRMVYEHGVGVKPAGGVRTDAAPEIGRDAAGEVLRKAGAAALRGARMSVHDAAEGKIAPALAR